MDQAYLTVSAAEGTRQVPLSDKPLTIGRHSDNTLVLNDGRASRYHCVIARTPDGQYLIRDLDSRNGTRVNGQPIKAKVLSSGDQITIGGTQMQLKAEVAQAQPVAAAVDMPEPIAEADSDLGMLESLAAAEEQRVTDFLTSKNISVVDNVAADFNTSSSQQDDEKFLPVLAESMPNKEFPAEEIALINTRGQVIHPAASKSNKKSSNPGTGDAVAVLRYVLLICVRGRATDIHIEPRNDDYQLRVRIDGNMVDIVRMTKPMGVKVCALVKILCNIDMQFRDIIQEGHFTVMLPSRRIDYRVSFAPAMFGQKLVVRILDTANAPLHVPDLQLPEELVDHVRAAAHGDQGMILVCGPTGSGKTTTLYAILRDVGVEHRNVVTIEDPVEIEIPGVTQVPVNDEKGNSFSNLLRSMLRQDPDVMMVGEIRDAETARIAMQSAMTGHLVLSTVHAKDTISTIFRILDLGAEPYLVSSSLQLVISQRLARQLCPYCKRAVRATPEQIERMGEAGKNVRDVYIPVGCPGCLKTGFAGRRAFFELLTSTEELREVILKNPTPKQIEASLAGTGFVRLRQAGYRLVAQGVTPFDEVDKALGR